MCVCLFFISRGAVSLFGTGGRWLLNVYGRCFVFSCLFTYAPYVVWIDCGCWYFFFRLLVCHSSPFTEKKNIQSERIKSSAKKKWYALHKYSSIFPYSSSISNTQQYALAHTHRLPRKQHNVLDTPNTLTHCTQNSKHTDIIVAAVGGWYWRLSIYTLYYTNALDSIAAMNN